MLDSDQVRTLVARSSEIRGGLVEFAQSPRYRRRLEARIAAAEDEYGELDQIRLIIHVHRGVRRGLGDSASKIGG